MEITELPNSNYSNVPHLLSSAALSVASSACFEKTSCFFLKTGFIFLPAKDAANVLTTLLMVKKNSVFCTAVT